MSENNTPPVQQTAAQNIHAGGNVLFGDINQTVVQQKTDFFELNTAQYTESEFAKLLLRSNLISLIRSISQSRFLVLSGDFRIDKASFARYLACCLSDTKLDADGHKLVVKEWYRSSDPQSIDVELQKTTTTTIFVLTQVSHQNIGYDLYRIRKAASDKHYIVVSTDLPFESWNLPERERNNLWHQFTDADVKKLVEFKSLINEFTQEESLENWYFRELTLNEQLISLGLCFFDGLFDDQFFAAVEQVAERVKLRDQLLRAPDYVDLGRLHNFFNFIETTSREIKRIEIRFPEHRLMLLKVVWKKYQRLIRNVLPVLVNLVKTSARSFSGELYGSDLRRNQLRKVITEAISNIGLISGDSVEDALLELAADNSIEVRAVAARAMALWRENKQNGESQNFNSEEMLFNTLQRWQYEKRILSLVANHLTGTSQEQSKRPIDYIRATVAITVGYAALYDSPNYLNNSLHTLLEQLIDDSNQLVRSSLRLYTLPIVISLHFNQLQNLLSDTAQKGSIDLIFGISAGVALAYKENSDEVSEILEKWQDPDKYDLLVGKDEQGYSGQQSLLATVALSYGQIQYDNNAHNLNTQRAFKYLDRILDKDKTSQFVRQSVVFAILLLSYRYLEQVDEQLRKFTSKFTTNERKGFIELLCLLYLEQRRELKDGDAEIEIDGQKYQIWIDKEKRPLTHVEKIILDWFKDERHVVAQRLAVQSMLFFAKILDQVEEKKIREIKNQTVLQTISSSSNENINLEHTASSFYIGKLASWWTTRTREEYRTTIYNLLPEISKHRQSCKKLIHIVFDRWNHTSDSEAREISSLLQEALKLVDNLPWMISLVGGFVIVPFTIGAVVAGIKVNTIPPSLEPATQIVSQTPSQSPSTEAIEPSIQPTPEAINSPSEPQSNPPATTQPEPRPSIHTQFDNDTFPKPVCGDPEPSPDDYPITLYPVYVNHSERNFQVIKEQYCLDALEREGQGKIQVASFSNQEKAEEFSEFLLGKFERAWVGEAERIERLSRISINPSQSQPSSSSPSTPSSQPAAPNSDSVCFEPHSENYDYGTYVIEFRVGDSLHEGRLQMQGSSGKMMISFFNLVTNQTDTVEQTMELAVCSFGLALFGNNPVIPNTRTRHPTYVPDNLYIWQQPNGSRAVFNIDDQNVYAPVVIRAASN
jgi:hypothetical protein